MKDLKGLIFVSENKKPKGEKMKKGIIAVITVMICAMLAVTYTFAGPGKARRPEKTEPTTEEKEVTTTTKEKTATETTTESKKAAIKEEASDEVDTDQESDDSEEITDRQEDEVDLEDEDDEEIDDEKMDQCDHNWTDGSYAYDTEKGYVYTESCSKCHLVKDTPVSYEEYEEATKDQEPNEEDCIYEDNDDAEVVE